MSVRRLQERNMLRPNGPELSCGGEAPQRRNPVRAWRVMSNSLVVSRVQNRRRLLPSA